jgi:undecaprenyl diphosphate synthase
MEKAESMTAENTTMTAIIAIGYGWQEEIARAVTTLIREDPEQKTITSTDILTYLETSQFPPIDLIIRTGGHIRHSGFFLFQSPYAEYYFSEKNWPDFEKSDIEAAIADFNERQRKYGK